MSSKIDIPRSLEPLENEQPTLGERENTMELIEKSEKINTLVKEQVGNDLNLMIVGQTMRPKPAYIGILLNHPIDVMLLCFSLF